MADEDFEWGLDQYADLDYSSGNPTYTEQDVVNLMNRFANRSDDEVSDSPDADPFYQGSSATKNPKENPYSTRASLLETQSKAAHADAMEKLSNALRNQPHISVEQGLAASLLALIPTIGGAIIGRSVGNANIPAGTFGAKGLEDTGSGAGGAMGAQVGTNAALGYLKGLDKTEEQNKVLMRMAEYQNRYGNELAQQAGQTQLAGLNAQEAEKQIGMREDAQYDRQVAFHKYQAEHPLTKAKDAVEAAKLNDPNYASALTKLMTPEDQGGGMKSLSSDEKSALIKYEGEKAISMTTSVENAASRGQNADRLLYGDLRFVNELGLNEPDSIFKVKDKVRAGQMNQAEAIKLKSQGAAAVNSVRQIEKAQKAFNFLGVAVNLPRGDSEAEKKKQAEIAVALHDIAFARQVVRDAYLKGTILSKGAASDEKIAEIETLLIPPPLTPTNASAKAIKESIFEKAPFRNAKLGEMRNNILNTLQAEAGSSGLDVSLGNIMLKASYDVGNQSVVDTSAEDQEIAEIKAILAKAKGAK